VDCPLLMTRQNDLIQKDFLEAVEVFTTILNHLKY
jgi:hypothetical protein